MCPSCETTIHRDKKNKNGKLTCHGCGWVCGWEDYRSTFKGKHLNAGRMVRWCQEYVQKFSTTRAYREKIVLIDTLIHRFHAELVGGNKPGAFALIEGEISDIAAFLARSVELR